MATDPSQALHPDAELTYASFDDPSGRGGWQVKELRGSLSDEDSRALQACVVTSLPHPGAGDLRFVTDEEAARWPRRLALHRFEVQGGVRTALMHSVSAGQDHSGRAGNVFTQAAVLADEDGPRPIELWRSPSWLTPFGPDAVRAATLGGPELAVSSGLADEVDAFLATGTNWRPGLLVLLLDAVRASTVTRRPTVLLCEDSDEAASWIKAISACLSARSSRQLFFSTLETPAAQEVWAQRGFHLVCLLRSAVSDARVLGEATVVDAAEDALLGSPDGDAHHTRRGDEVPAGVWGSLFLERYSLDGSVARLIADMDALDRRVPGAPSDDLGWTLALNAALRGDTEFLALCRAVTAGGAPQGVESDPEIAQLVSSCLLDLMGHSSAERWAALRKLRSDGRSIYLLRLAAVAYAQSALADEAWLRSAPDMSPVQSLRPELSSVSRDAVQAFKATEPGGDLADRAVAAVSAWQLVQALGWDVEGPVRGVFEELADSRILPALMDPTAADAVFRRAQPLSLTQGEALRELLLSAPPDRIPRSTLAALGLLDEQFLLSDLARADQGRKLSGLGGRIATELVEEASRAGRPAPSLAVAYAYWAVEQEARGWYYDEFDPRWQRFLTQAMDPWDALTLWRSTAGHLPATVVAQMLLSGPITDDEIRTLAAEVSTYKLRPLTRFVSAVADGSCWGRDFATNLQTRVTDVARWVAEIHRHAPGWKLDPMLASSVAVLATVASFASGASVRGWEALPDTATDARVAARGVQLTKLVLHEPWVSPAVEVLATLLSRPEGPEDRRELGEWWATRGVHKDGPSWAEAVLEATFATVRDRGDLMDEGILHRVAAWGRAGVRPDDAVDREKRVRAWLKRHGIDSRARGSLFRSMGRGRDKSRESR